MSQDATLHRGSGLLPWLVSIAAHCCAVAALCFQVHPAPRGVAIRPVHEIQASFGHSATFTLPGFAADIESGTGVVLPASFTRVHSAPVLLPASQPPSGELANQPNDVPPAAGDNAPRDGARAAAKTGMFGVQGRGNRFVYVCDRSASMAGHQGRPLAAAKRELIGSLQHLQGVHQFQIIFYNETPEPMPLLRGGPPSLVMADERGKRQAEQFIGSIYSHGGTQPMAALAMALAMRPDVLFLLADANPPGLSPDDLQRLRRLNRGTAINTIEFGVGPSPGEYNFLRQLAEEHGGQHAYVNVTGLPRAVEPRGESISAALPLLPQPATGRGLGAAP